MWQVKLFTGIVNGIKIVAKNKNIARKSPIIARTILNKGNGQLRTVVKGFGEGNLTAEDIIKNAKINLGAFRRVISGFTGESGLYRLTTPSFMSRAKFFPIFRIPKLTRHYVANVNSSRNVVSGFNNLVDKSLKINRAIPNPQPMQVNPDKRIVIQGFGGDATKPIYKQIELRPSAPRAVIKGFGG